MTEKSIVLVDAENLFHGWNNYCKENNLSARVDYVKLVGELSKGTNLLRAYFYDGIPDQPTAAKKSFHKALEHHGFQIRTKVLKKRSYVCENCKKESVRWVQKGVDIALATDILRHSWQKTCDICIVVSGDEDYKDAIDCAKDIGIKVWVASFRGSLSNELRRSADKVIYLEDILKEIVLISAAEQEDKSKV